MHGISERLFANSGPWCSVDKQITYLHIFPLFPPPQCAKSSMASTIVILCFAAAICYIIRWLFLYIRGGQEKIEGIRNKYVLITGSGSGFGKQIAVQLDKLGVRVIATCRTKAGEESVRAACSNRVKTYCMDVTDVNQVREVFESVKEEIPADEGNSKLTRGSFFLGQ